MIAAAYPGPRLCECGRAATVALLGRTDARPLCAGCLVQLVASAQELIDSMRAAGVGVEALGVGLAFDLEARRMVALDARA